MGTIASIFNAIAIRILVTLKALASPVALGASALVTDGQGRVVLVRHSYQPGWHLPGGGVSAGEPPAHAVVREAREEIGLRQAAAPEFRGIFTRRMGWVTNTIVLFHIRDAVLDFKPSLEIREICWVDPNSPPRGTTAGTRRRLAEFAGEAPPSPYW